MPLTDHLHLEHIFLDIAAEEAEPALAELTCHLVGDGTFTPTQAEEILGTLVAREEQSSTAVGCGVAIPHARTDITENLTSIFARSLKGVEFDSPDNCPVHLILILIVPTELYSHHLKTLAAAAKLLSQAKVRERLLTAATAKDILTIFSEESTLSSPTQAKKHPTA